MDLITVSCNQCAAPLEVASSSRFVTCSFCKSRLEVHRSESAVYTEVLDRLNERTAAIGQDVFVIRKQNELAQLDREWAAAKHQPHDNHQRGSLVGLLLVLPVLAVFAMLGLSLLRVNSLFGILWLSLVVFIAIQVISTSLKGNSPSRSEAEYFKRRNELLRDIEGKHRS